MIIETKYDIGQEVWLFVGENPVCGKVTTITTETEEEETRNYYDVKVGDYWVGLIEWGVFPTKEELLKSL